MYASVLLLMLVVLSACDKPTAPAPPERPGGDVTDPALRLPWSEVNGRIAVHFLAPDNSRGTILIDGVRRAVVFMGDLGTYVGSIALSPDGGELALGYVLGSAFGNLAGIHIARTENGNVGTWGASDIRGHFPAYRRDGRLSYWRGDTLMTNQSVIAVVRGSKTHPHTWSRSDSTVALVLAAAGVAGIHTLRPPADSARLILRSTASAIWSAPAFSPVEDVLAVKRSTSAQEAYSVGDIWLINADGSGAHPLREPGVSAFAWSPDGSQLVFTGGQANCPGCPPMEQPGVYLLRVSDRVVRKLMDLNAFLVAWSR